MRERTITGFALLLLEALLMAGNHVAARLAFDHGASVATAVLLRSSGTALVVGLLVLGGLAWLRWRKGRWHCPMPP